MYYLRVRRFVATMKPGLSEEEKDRTAKELVEKIDHAIDKVLPKLQKKADE